MAEVTREMILDYMRAKGGVVKNVDLVRHFRKSLQLSDQRAKDQAREKFKARVNEVAYIKADSKGEKYLYLKAEYSTTTSHSASSERDSTHLSVSKRDSAHSLLSKRDSAFSILSDTSSYNQSPGHGTSTQKQTSPPRQSPAHTSSYTQRNSTAGSSRYQSGQPSYQSGQSSNSTAPVSVLGDSLLSDSAFSSFLGGGSLGSGATPTTGGGSSSSSATPKTTTVSGSSTSSSGLQSNKPSTRTSGLSKYSSTTTPKATPSSVSGGGSSSATPTTGIESTPTGGAGDSSFASDIFGAIGGGFWGDSTALTGLSSDTKTSSKPAAPPSSTTASSSSSSGGGGRHSSSNRGSSSQVAGGGSSDIALQSYRPLSSPPRQPSPPPTSHTSTKAPSPPFTRSTRAAPPPPQRNLNYTTVHPSPSPSSSSSALPATGGSVFSPPPRTEGSSLLSDLTSGLGSFGEIGSFLDSFGDFTKKPATASQTRTSQHMADHTTSLTGSSSSSTTDRSSVTLVSKATPPPPPASSPPSSTSHTRGSPGKSSAAGPGSVTGVRSTPPPAPGSPMRVPRGGGGGGRSGGLAAEPPHPPLSRRYGSLDGQEGSPRISMQRIDSPRSDSPSNGGVSPPHQGGVGVSPPHQLGGANEVRGRPPCSGLPPLPPSALGANSDLRRISAATNGGVGGVVLRPQVRDRVQSSARRSRNFDKTANLDSLTRASIMMTPPSVRRDPNKASGLVNGAPGPGGSGMYARPAPSSSGEDLSQYQEGGDQDGSLSAPSDDYEELDPLEKEWMLACASGDLESLLNIMIRDDTLINRKDFLHGYTALHWAAKLGRCDIMSTLIISGAFPNIKSGGFTALHLACQGGYDNAIAMLIRDQGANVNIRDNSGRKPVDMLNYSCPESIRALLTDRQTGIRTVHHSSEYLPSFSQPRNRHGSLTNTWASMPNSLENSDEKKKRVSPKMSKRTFSFRNKHKLTSLSHDKKDRPRSHVPETYDA